MSEETPPDPPAEPDITENIEDPQLKAGIQAILKQNSEMALQNKEMKDIITKHDTERELAKFEKQRIEKLGVLEKLRPELAKKHKDTKDLGTLQTVIDTAKEIRDDFPEYDVDKTKDVASKKPQFVKPRMYKA